MRHLDLLRSSTSHLMRACVVLGCLAAQAEAQLDSRLERVKYNHPGLVVDLGVGLWAWPLPIDFDGDGDLDLVVSCPDRPFGGTYFFENPETPGDEAATMPVFKAPVRVGGALSNAQLSIVDGRPRVLSPGVEWLDFLGEGFTKSTPIFERNNIYGGSVRANQWRYVDYDGDGRLDLVVGVGDWKEYGWDDAFDAEGNWTRGPLHGYVYLLRNRGDDEQGKPQYEPPRQLTAGEKPIDVFGMPSPNFADFDGDGDLDLICGEFLDGFTYFENTGTRTEPVYAAGRRLMHDGRPLVMDLQMITPNAIDWDGDGHWDLIVGDEDGRVALVKHTGKVVDGLPQFLPPQYFQQEADLLKFGALSTPVGYDWDGDGDEDLICGNTAGYIAFIENLDGGNPPRWAAPVLLRAGDEVLRITAGPNGSIQGPAEAKWGYTTLSVADWDHDGLPDLIVNSIWGKVVWYRNIGRIGKPKLAAAAPIQVEWAGKPPKPAWNWWNPEDNELATQWRTTPVAIDFDQDGLTDLVMLDHEGYLAFFRREKRGEQLVLLPGERIFTDERGEPLRLNDRRAGGSGRRKLCFADWDGDGRLDLIVNSKNADWYRNVFEDGPPWKFRPCGPLDGRVLAGHTTSPTTVDWNGDGRRDLLIGGEDGHFYYMENDPARLPQPQTISTDEVEVRTVGIRWKTLAEGETAYANRDYVWLDVPEQLSGRRYTQTAGGVPAEMQVKALRDTTVTIATATEQPGIDLAGWQAVESPTFAYTDGGKTRMRLFRRDLKQGEELAVPQGNWSGGLLLLPPTRCP